MTYHIYYSIFEESTFILLFAFHTERSKWNCFFVYFAFVEDDHSSTLAAAKPLL